MIILYKEDGEKVKKIEVLKKNEFYVFFPNGVRESVNCIHHSYHNTYEEAKEELINRLEQKVRIAEHNLKDAQEKLYTIKVYEYECC